MSSQDTIEKLFEKAASLSGRRLTSFLATQPPGIRKQLRRLLQANEDASEAGFLKAPLRPPVPSAEATADTLGEEANKEDRPKLTAAPRPSASKKKSPGSHKSRRPSPSRTTPSSGRPRRLPGKAKKSTSKRSRSTVKNRQAVLAVVGVISCAVFLGFIWTALNALTSTTVDPISPDPARIAATGPASLASEPAESLVPDQSATTEPADSAPAANDRTFYAEAIRAAPPTQKPVDALTQLGHPPLVAHPIQLPGIRSWTIETVPFRCANWAIDLDRSGQRAVFGDWLGGARIFNLQNQTFLGAICTPDTIFEVFWLPNNVDLLVRTGTNVRVYNSSTGAVLREYKGDNSLISVDQSRQRFYTKHDSQIVSISTTDFSDIEQVGLSTDIRNVTVSPSGGYLFLSQASDQRIEVWTNERPPVKCFTINRQSKTDPQWCSWSNEDRLAIGWGSGLLEVYEPGNGSDIPIYEKQVVEDRPYYWCSCKAWIDRDTLVFSGLPGTWQYLHVPTGKIIRRVNANEHSNLCYRPDLNIGASTFTPTAVLKDGLPGPELNVNIEVLCRDMQFSADGNELIVSGAYRPSLNLETGQRTSRWGQIDAPWDMRQFVASHRKQDGRCLIGYHNAVEIRLPTADGDLEPVRWPFETRTVEEAIWIDAESAAAVRLSNGKVMLVRPGRKQPEAVELPAAPAVSDFVWHQKTQRLLLLTPTLIYEFDPASMTSRPLLSLKDWNVQEISMNFSESLAALNGSDLVVLDTQDWRPLHRYSNQNKIVRWASENELVGIKGTEWVTLQTATGELSRVQIPAADVSPWNIAFSPTAPVAAVCMNGGQLRFFDRRNGNLLGINLLMNGEDLLLTAEGRIVGASPGILERCFYQILTDEGQQTLTPAEFLKRFGDFL